MLFFIFQKQECRQNRGIGNKRPNSAVATNVEGSRERPDITGYPDNGMRPTKERFRINLPVLRRVRIDCPEPIYQFAKIVKISLITYIN
ncbi:MAG: hypothetical protein K2J42_08075, partial [Muribaculaceae bacterium]|nr:hypothetical protein [Muribaculaceae bacterium]